MFLSQSDRQNCTRLQRNCNIFFRISVFETDTLKGDYIFVLVYIIPNTELSKTTLLYSNTADRVVITDHPFTRTDTLLLGKFLASIHLSPKEGAHSAQDALLRVIANISVSSDLKPQKFYGLCLTDYTIDRIINSLESL
jgi:hypothetical protein